VTVKIQTHGKSQNEVNEEIGRIKEQFQIANREYRQANPKKNRVLPGHQPMPKSKVLDLLKVNSKYDLKLDCGDDGCGNSIFIIGSSKRGKSTLLMDIYDKYFNKKNIITTLFSINSHKKLYKDPKKRLIKCNKFNDKGQRLIKQMKRINFKCKNKYDFCVMFDDVTNVRYNNLMNDLILTYRNSDISSIVSLQYPNLLNKSARASINNIIFFGLNSDESIIVALNSFLKSHFSKLGIIGETEQINFYKELTADHQFIYLHPESGTMSVHKLKLN